MPRPWEPEPRMENLAPFESSVAEHYHEETKYTEQSLRDGARRHPQPDWSRPPVPFRVIEGPRYLLPSEGLPIERRGSVPPEPPRGRSEFDVDLYRLSRLLWHTNGCTRIVQHASGVHHFRAAPSAGAMYPTEVYVALTDIRGIDDGIYNYQILDHSLARVTPGDHLSELAQASFGHPAFETSRAVVLLTAEFHRSSWRYRERGYRRALLDTGHVLGNLVEAAPAEGVRAVPLGCFLDGPCERMLDLEPLEEGVLVMAPLVSAQVAPDLPPPETRRSPLTEWHAAVSRVSDRIPEPGPEQLIAALHVAGRIAGDSGDVTGPIPPPPAVPDGSVRLDTGEVETHWDAADPVTDTIARRRSTRSFAPAPVARDGLFRALEHGHPRDSEGLFAPELLRTYLVSMNVVGLPPGTYLFRHESHELVELSRGQVAKEMLHLGLGQEIFLNAAVAVVHTCDLTRAVSRYGDRAYRLLHLDAGHIGERLNLALLKEGAGVSGCAGFYDDEMNRVLQIPESQAVIYITCVGMPA